jgi:hypothetical protein
MGASSSTASCGEPSRNASAAAARRIPAPARSIGSSALSATRAARRLADQDLRLHDPPAHLDGEHVLPREQRPHRLRGAEGIERLLEPALGEPHERARVVDERLRVELGRRLRRALDPLQPLPGLVNAAQPRERGCARRVRGSDDAVGAPAVLLGEVTACSLSPQPMWDGRPADVGRQRQVAEAADLQVRPSDAARERERFLEVAAGVVTCSDQSSTMPKCISADARWSSRRATVSADWSCSDRIACRAAGRSPRWLASQSLGAAQPEIEEPPLVVGHPVGRALGERDERRGVVEQTVVEAGDGDGQRQLRVALGRVGREGVEQRADRRRAAAEHQVDVVVGQQPGSMRPVARSLGVADRLDHVPALAEPVSPPRGAAGRSAPAWTPQLELEQVGEQVVVAEPRPGHIE